ncbi:hypothetical protein ACOME3_002566 [Neoechinorhynchus agilis]
MHLRAVKYMQALEKFFSSKDSNEKERPRSSRRSNSLPVGAFLRKTKSARDAIRQMQQKHQPFEQCRALNVESITRDDSSAKIACSIDASSNMTAVPIAGTTTTLECDNFKQFARDAAINTEKCSEKLNPTEKEQISIYLKKLKEGVQHIQSYINNPPKEQELCIMLENAHSEIAHLKSENERLKVQLQAYQNNLHKSESLCF